MVYYGKTVLLVHLIACIRNELSNNLLGQSCWVVSDRRPFRIVFDPRFPYAGKISKRRLQATRACRARHAGDENNLRYHRSCVHLFRPLITHCLHGRARIVGECRDGDHKCCNSSHAPYIPPARSLSGTSLAGRTRTLRIAIGKEEACK